MHPRRWDHLVQKPLAVSAYSLSLQQAEDLLRSVGMPLTLIRCAFKTFARRQERSSSWSRVLGEAPERRIDALELFSGLALTCRASLNDKLTILFCLFDTAEAGVLTVDDLGAMISSCASVLRQLGLSLPVSNDEAAFAAGAAFGHPQPQGTGSAGVGCSNYELACDVDEIDLPLFLTWAQRAKLPICALEMLALPHRLSRMIDLASSKACLILQEATAKCNSSNATSSNGRKASGGCVSDRSLTKRRVTEQRPDRANMLPLLKGSGGNSISHPLALPPYLGGIGPHNAIALFEIGSRSNTTAKLPTLRVVVSVEERCGSCFSLVDSQLLNLRVGEPGVLLLSCLRASTDHRLTISWGGATETRKNGDAKRKIPGGRHITAECSTLRFATLPADSLMTSPNPAGEADDSSSANKEISSSKHRRYITLVDAWQKEAYSPDEAHHLQPYPTNSSSGNTMCRNTMCRKGVSVLINHGRRTCLESAETNLGVDPWWGASTESTVTDPDSSDQTNSHALVQSWPLPAPASNDETPRFPTAEKIGKYGASSVALSFAPFCRDVIKQTEAPAQETAVPWARSDDVGSGDIDLMLHLNPDWRAPAVLRRCFHVLGQCRFESSAVRKDGRRMVATEVSMAIRSLVTRCFRARRDELRDVATRRCAHIVLGELQHPWLGLTEVSVGQFSLKTLPRCCSTQFRNLYLC